MLSLHCSFCQHANPADAKYCNECGSALQLKPCERCDAVNNLDATSCHHCGCEFTDTTSIASHARGGTGARGEPSSSSVVRALATVEADLAGFANGWSSAASTRRSSLRVDPTSANHFDRLSRTAAPPKRGQAAVKNAAVESTDSSLASARSLQETAAPPMRNGAAPLTQHGSAPPKQHGVGPPQPLPRGSASSSPPSQSVARRDPLHRGASTDSAAVSGDAPLQLRRAILAIGLLMIAGGITMYGYQHTTSGRATVQASSPISAVKTPAPMSAINAGGGATIAARTDETAARPPTFALATADGQRADADRVGVDTRRATVDARRSTVGSASATNPRADSGTIKASASTALAANDSSVARVEASTAEGMIAADRAPAKSPVRRTRRTISAPQADAVDAPDVSAQVAAPVPNVEPTPYRPPAGECTDGIAALGLCSKPNAANGG